MSDDPTPYTADYTSPNAGSTPAQAGPAQPEPQTAESIHPSPYANPTPALRDPYPDPASAPPMPGYAPMPSSAPPMPSSAPPMPASAPPMAGQASAPPSYGAPAYGPPAYAATGQLPVTPADQTQFPGQPQAFGQPAFPGQPFPGQPIPGQPIPGQPFPGQQFPGQPPFAGAPQPFGVYPVGSPWPIPVPVEPKRRVVNVGVLVAVAVAVALVCGFGGLAVGLAIHRSSSNSAAAQGVDPTSPDYGLPVATPTASTVVLDGPGLLAKMVPMPAGARDIPVSDSAKGVMTVDQYVARFFPDRADTEKGLLQQRDFRVAAEKCWIGTDGIEYAMQLIQFGDSTGADSFISAQNNAFSIDPAFTSDFEVLAVPQGHGYVNPGLDKAGNKRSTLLAQADSVAIVMNVFAPKTFDQKAEIALITDQYNAVI